MKTVLLLLGDPQFPYQSVFESSTQSRNFYVDLKKILLIMFLRFSRNPTLMYKWTACCVAVDWCTTHSTQQCPT